jgi:signal transduction histidine kinase
LIWADKTLLTNVYDNLIHNALLFGDQGGNIIITIMERGNVDEFSVWYSGQGLDTRCLESLGERLTYDANDVARRNAEIGIYLASKIVEAHGGSLWAEAQANSWMNFIFTLPKREVAIRERTDHANDFCFNACQ